jgi:hypothetical protein
VHRSNVWVCAASFFATPCLAVTAHAQMPAAIAAPGEAIVVTLQAEGAQIYECKPGAGGLSWAFREPIATLLLDGKTVGRHYAGPNWEYIDGSGVAGKVAASVPGRSASDIPWLKLNATTRRGRGTLSAVSTIQRIDTRGGVHSGPCGTAGAYFSAPYSAVYVFLQQGG